MAAMDRDTFIPLGTSIVKLLLIASGQGALATAVGEGAGLLAKFRRTLEIGGNRAVFAEKIADDAAKQLLREHQGISEADWHVAARQAASLIDQLSEKERLAAGYNWEELRRTLLDLGGTDLRSDLADESARQAFDWVLEVACQRIADCFTEKEALASILESVEEVRAGIQRLAERPAGASQTRAVVADHMEVVRDLAPDPLEDRERELAELETFVRGSQDTWYAMEAGMISGKTALMSSFALNPPDGVHIVSFFIRRMGGDGNDWKSFSFVAGAQLAEILGDEYTERVSEPASQNTEFRQLLRRAATACQSDKNPRPLVLVIDGVDEDSYYERPDEAAAKSILSLLPRHLPEGVKLVTASRPNPRMPEDIVCNSSRTIASLKPSPIAQEKINQKDIETFFKSDLAVDIGAFLAACGGFLTIDELRQLIARHRHLENVPSRDVKACVDHSPGRMLMRVNVGFGNQEIPSYILGHDAVLRAVLREISPDGFGKDDESKAETWWASARGRALKPYRRVIRAWVEKRAADGWNSTTPNYMLSEPCFDMMTDVDVERKPAIDLVFDSNRYHEIWRRFGRRSHVLRTIERDYSKVLELYGDEVPENSERLFLEIVELKEALARMESYLPGMLELSCLYFNAPIEKIQDTVLSLDSVESRLRAVEEVGEACVRGGRGCELLNFFPEVLDSLNSCPKIRDELSRILIDIVAVDIGALGHDVDEVSWRTSLLRKYSVWCGFTKDSLQTSACVNPSSLEVDCCSQAYSSYWNSLKAIVDSVEEPAMRFRIIIKLLCALIGVKRTEQSLVDDGTVWRCNFEPHLCLSSVSKGVPTLTSEVLAGHICELVESIDSSRLCAEVSRNAAVVLLSVGMMEEARRCAITSQRAAWRVDDFRLRTEALRNAVVALVSVGMMEEARRCANVVEQLSGRVSGFRWRAEALANSVVSLASVGLAEQAEMVAEEVQCVVAQIDDPWWRVEALVKVQKVFVDGGLIDRAQRIAQEIDDVRLRDQAHFNLVRELTDSGSFDLAQRVTGLIGDSRLRGEALMKVACAFAGAGLLERAREAVEKAQRTVEKVADFRLRGEALMKVACAFAGAGLLEQAQKVAERIGDFQERLPDLACVAARAGYVEQARQVAYQIDDQGVRAAVLVRIVDDLVSVGAVEQAQETSDRVINLAEGIYNVRLRAEVLIKALCVLINLGFIEHAFDMASRTVLHIEEWHSRNEALVKLVIALSEVGQADRARDAFERITGSWWRETALFKMSGALADAGRFEQAQEVAAEIKRSWWRGEALVKIAGDLADAGRFEQAQEVAAGVMDSWRCGEALVKIAGALADAGRFEQAQEVAAGVMDSRWRGEALVKIAGALADAGQFEQAQNLAFVSMELAEDIADSSLREGAVSRVVRHLVKVGLLELAESVVKRVASFDLRVGVQFIVVKAMIQNGMMLDAADVVRWELRLTEILSDREDAANCCLRFARLCSDVGVMGDSYPADVRLWNNFARGALVRSWSYRASVWEHFDFLLRVAPELAVQLVDERILIDPEGCPAPESDPDLGPEGPGGDAGAYR